MDDLFKVTQFRTIEISDDPKYQEWSNQVYEEVESDYDEFSDIM
jgi:hypothetical protein